MQDEYHLKDGTVVRLVPGRKVPNDKIIVTEFPQQHHAHSLEYIALVLRLKAEIEDLCYPPTSGYRGRYLLLDFVIDAITTDLPMDNLLKKYKIPR